MTITQEAARLFFAISSLILVGMLTTPSFEVVSGDSPKAISMATGRKTASVGKPKAAKKSQLKPMKVTVR